MSQDTPNVTPNAVTPNTAAAQRLSQEQLTRILTQLPQQYELLGRVGEGGMGFIYKAKNRFTGAHVAIKILRVEQAADQRALQRFIYEARAASALKHAHICQVFDFGQTEDGIPYLVMDWIDGISLAKKVARDARISVTEAVPIFQQVVQALVHAHEKKVVHRDLKPENIMLTRDEQGRTEIRVVDFGIAKVLDDGDSHMQMPGLTKTGIVVGTPTYMSPEQARGVPIDGRTDVYSFGCVMYFALTGKPPFLGATVIDTITKHLSEPPPDIDPALKIPVDLKRVVLKAIEKDPDDRYQSMEELAGDLRKLSKGVSLERRLLAGEKEAIKKRAVLIACFIIGFVIMYVVSIGLQDVMDSTASKPGQNSSTVHKSH